MTETINNSVEERAEETLLNTEQGLKDIIYGSPIPQFIIDRNHRIVHWNKALEEITGITASEVIGTSRHWRAFYDAERLVMADLMLEGDMEKIHELYGECKEYTLKVDRCEAVDFFPTSGKEGMWLHLTVLPIKDADGQVIGALEALQDITEQKRAEELLKQSEERYRLIAENVRDTIFTIDLYGKATFVSPSVESLTGFTPEEAMEHNMDGVMTPGSVEVAKRDMEGIISQAREGKHIEPSSLELEFIRKDGSEVWAEVTSSGMFDEAGRLVGIEGVVRDITERKKAEKKSEMQMRCAKLGAEIGIELTRGDDLITMLRLSGEAVVRYFAAALVRIWTLAKDKDVLELQASAGLCTHMDGQDGHIPMGKTIIGIIAQEKKPFITNKAIGDPNITCQEWVIKERITAFTGHPLVVEDRIVGAMAVFSRAPFDEIMLSALTSIANGVAVGIVRKQKEEEISRLNEELQQKVEQLIIAQDELVRKEKLSILGQLAGTVGHEIRNPLGVMNNAVYFLKTIMPDADDVVKEYLDIISQEIGNSLRIVTDLLDFSRTKKPQANPLAVKALVEQSLSKCNVPENIKTDIEISDELPLLNVDIFQIMQVLRNIITNAVQAMPDGGTLKIKAHSVQDLKDKEIEFEASDQATERNFIEINITDTGMGILPENMKKLFQPLFTTKVKGIGLGLVVCKNLIEANRGKISVNSHLGNGSTFTILLPTSGGDE